ncbi:hypothetical protein [Paenibacillus alvei]|uniref:hypothetical protein n=1 Tax=Paenibacillus alvei TaxID=44250 RepID=UPI0019D4F5B9|nr:hypothetical protein [Paenibacillus alvei]MCY9578623.1 hypothetical protein [Paenibacillus alvei]
MNSIALQASMPYIRTSEHFNVEPYVPVNLLKSVGLNAAWHRGRIGTNYREQIAE